MGKDESAVIHRVRFL